MNILKATKRTNEDCKKAADLGAFGIQIAPPALNDPNQDDILRFYSDVSDNVDIGIMIYNTPWQRYGAITAETLYRLREYENIVAIKWATYEDCPDTEMERLGAHFNLKDCFTNFPDEDYVILYQPATFPGC